MADGPDIKSLSGLSVEEAKALKEAFDAAAAAAGGVTAVEEKHRAILEKIGFLLQENAQHYANEKALIQDAITYSVNLKDIIKSNLELRQLATAAAKGELDQQENIFKAAQKRKVQLQSEVAQRDALYSATTKQLRDEETRLRAILADKLKGLGFSERDIAARAAILAEDKRARDLALERFDIQMQHLDTLNSQINQQDILGQLALHELETKRKILSATAEAEKAQTGLVSGAEGLIGTLSGVSDAWEGTFAGSIVLAGRYNVELEAAQLAGEEWAEGLEAIDIQGNLTDTITQTLNPLNMAGSLLTKMAQSTIALTVELDSLAASFRKTTGLGKEWTSTLNDGYRANLAYGVSMADSAAANTAFVTGMADFTMMANDQREALTDNVLLLGEMGVGMDTAAQAANFLSKGLGMTGEEIAATNRDLVGLAEALKVPPDVIFKDFAAASKELAKYGDDMIVVFKGLEEQAKNTGLSVTDLLGIAKQFDQFDTAGEAVGRLNAILGGPYLNAIDMVNMSEEQRIEALRETMEMSGRVFNELSRHEQQAIATAAGISDMEQASKLFGGTSEEFEAHALSQAEMQEKAAENQAAMEKLTQAGMALGVALTPLIEIIADIADAFMGIMTLGGGLVKLFGGEDQGLISSANTLTTVIIASAAAWKLLSTEVLATYGAALLPVVAFAAFFIILKKGLMMFDGVSRAIAGLIVTLIAGYAAWELFWAGATVGGSLLTSVAKAAAVAGLAAGAWGMVSGMKGKKLAEGVTDFEGGTALVGEEGPELVTMGKGANVVTNENVEKMSGMQAAAGDGQTVFVEILKTQYEGLVAAMKGPEDEHGKGKETSDTGTPTMLVEIVATQYDPLLAATKAGVAAGMMEDAKNVGQTVWGGAKKLFGFQGGVTNFGGGPMMVGEGGPEIMTAGPGTNVVTNENTQRIVQAAQQGQQAAAGGGSGADFSSLQMAIDNLSRQLSTVAQQRTKTPAAAGGGQIIRLELDRRVLGETMVDYLDKDSELSLLGG